MDTIYLDHNATTPVLPEVCDAMRPFFAETFGNPSSAHAAGRRARQALEDARESVASVIDADSRDVIFTSGATEANNLAIFGLCGRRPGRILASGIEHPSVAEPMQQLQKEGRWVDYLPCDSSGLVSWQHSTSTVPTKPPAGDRLDDNRDHGDSAVGLVTLMLVNNETGALQPVREVFAAAAREFPDAVRHCDAAQAAGRVPVSFRQLGATSLALSGHKFFGPKGIGVWVLKRDTPVVHRQFGGHQQRGLRPGTEPVALAVGLARALEIAQRDMRPRLEKVARLRALFLNRLAERTGSVVLNGPDDPTRHVPHTANISFPGVPAEVLLMNFDLAGVACSAGSACSSGSLLPSPVLRAMSVAPELLRSAVRFSFGHTLGEEAVVEAAERIIQVLGRLRSGPPEGPTMVP